MHLFPHSVWTMVSVLCGYNEKAIQIDMARLPMMANNDVGGTSAKNGLHWQQMVQSGLPAMFDYGKDGNIREYG